MIKRQLITALMMAALSVLPLLNMAYAQDSVKNTKPENAKPIMFYGQNLYPHLIKVPAEEFKWQDVAHYVPDLLPASQLESKTPEGICDHVTVISRLYLSNYERRIFNFTGKRLGRIKEVVGRLGKPVDDSEVDVFISEYITSNEWERLKTAFPDDVRFLDDLRQTMLKSVALQYVRDAALQQCPDYALEKNYTPSYLCNGLNTDLAPDLCAAIAANKPKLSNWKPKA